MTARARLDMLAQGSSMRVFEYVYQKLFDQPFSAFRQDLRKLLDEHPQTTQERVRSLITALQKLTPGELSDIRTTPAAEELYQHLSTYFFGIEKLDREIDIGEHAFRAGWDARRMDSINTGGRGSVDAAWNDYTPPDALCGGGIKEEKTE